MGKRPAYHCADCAHVPGRAALTAGANRSGAMLAGVAILSLDLLPGAVLIALGAAAIGGSYVTGRRRGVARSHLPLPVLPKIEELSVREELHGRITLGGGLRLQGQTRLVEGKITAVLTLGRPGP